MTQGTQPSQRRRYWLITSPRTASNLLVKMLNLDEQGVRPAFGGGYFFLPSLRKRFTLLKKPMNTWTEEERAELKEVLQQCFDNFQDHVAASEREGQVLFVKEHAVAMTHPYFETQVMHGDDKVQGEPEPLLARDVEHPSRSPLNLTSLPDEFLKTWHPTFLIRHPALQFPSLYRTCFTEFGLRPKQEPMALEVTMRWIRTLYDFYSEHFGNDDRWPLVLDADDVMTCPPLVAKYARMSGLDENKVRYTWEKAGEETLNKLGALEQRMLSSINASTTIDHSKIAGNIDIAKEAVKWRSEFGEEGGRKLEKWVRDAMPDYNFLYSKRLRLDEEERE